jgi:hypothetical protein
MRVYKDQGYDINKGMIVEYNDIVFHGVEGVRFLNSLLVRASDKNLPTKKDTFT